MLLYNENKLDDMGHILDHYNMSLVPAVVEEQETTLADGKTIKFNNSHFFFLFPLERAPDDCNEDMRSAVVMRY